MVSSTSNNIEFDSAGSCNDDNSIFIFGRQDLPINCNNNSADTTVPQTSNGFNSDTLVNKNAQNSKGIPTVIFGRQSDLQTNCKENIAYETVLQKSSGIESNLPVNNNARNDNSQSNPIFIFGGKTDLPINCNENTANETVPQTSSGIDSDSPVNNTAARNGNSQSNPIFIFGRKTDLPINCNENTANETVPHTSSGIDSDSSVNNIARNDNSQSNPIFIFGGKTDLPINCNENTANETVPQTSSGIDSDSSDNNIARNDNSQNNPIFIFGVKTDLPINCNKNTANETVPHTSSGIDLDSPVNNIARNDNSQSNPIFIFGGKTDLPINCNENTANETVPQTSSGIDSDSPVNNTARNDNSQSNPIFIFGGKTDLPINCNENTAKETIPKTSSGIKLDCPVNHTVRNDNSQNNPIFIFGGKPDLQINSNKNTVNETVPKTSSGIESDSPVNHTACNDNNQSNNEKDKLDMIFAEEMKIAGDIHFKNKNYAESHAKYDEAVNLWKNPAYLCRRSEALLMLEKYDEALLDAQTATELDSTFIDGYICKAKCCLILGELTIGKEAVRRASELGADMNKMQLDFDICNKKYEGWLWAMKSRCYHFAMIRMDECLILSPGCLRFKLNRAECLVMVGRHSEGKHIAQNIILKSKESDQAANYILGLSYYYQEEYDQAFDIFSMLIYNYNDKKAMEIYDKAKQLKEKKEKGKEAYCSEKWQLALDLYNEALAIDEFNTRVNAKLHFNKADIYVIINKLEEAVEAYTAALKLDYYNHSKALLKRAHCYFKLGRYTEALKDYEKVYMIDNSTENRRLMEKVKSLKNNIESAEKMKDRGNEYYKRQSDSAMYTEYNAYRGNGVHKSDNHIIHLPAESNANIINNEEETVLKGIIKLDLKETSNENSAKSDTKDDTPNERVKSDKMIFAEEMKIAGDIHFKNKNYAESHAKYDEAVNLWKNPAYLCRRSEALLMLEKYDEALLDAQTATELDSTFLDGYICKAKCCLILGKLKTGEKALRSASELGADMNKMQSDFETCNKKYKAGLWAIESSNYQMAITKIDDCLILSPGCFWFKLKKAECLAMVGRYSEAEHIAQTRLKFKESDHVANYILGLCYYFQEEYDQAFHIFTMLINDFDDKKAMKIYDKAKQLKEKKEKGNEAYLSEKWQLALDLYNEALAIDEFNTRVNAKLHYNKAAVFVKMTKLEEAVEAYTAALKLDYYNYSKALLKRAHCYMELGRYTEAVKDYENVYEIDKSTENRSLMEKAKSLKNYIESAEKKKDRGNEYYKSKDYERALNMYDEAVRLCPANHTYLSNRSATFMQLGRYKEALADSKKSVDLDATFVKGYIRIAKCCVVLGELALGEYAIRRATELGGSDSVKDEQNILKTLRRLQIDAENAMKANLFLRAIDFIDSFLKDSPSCSEMKLCKAECLAMLGRCREAEELALSVDANANKNYVLGLCRYFENDSNNAVNLLKKALDDSKAMDLLKKIKQLKEKYDKGNNAFDLQNWLQAIHFYEEGLTIDKNNRNLNSKLYYRKGIAHKKLYQLEKAIQAFTNALEQSKTYEVATVDNNEKLLPSNIDECVVHSIYERADCYTELGEYEKAVPDYEELYMYNETEENQVLLEEATKRVILKRKDYHYWVLGITTTASQDDIKKAYRRCALISHPDKNSDASPAKVWVLQRRFRIQKTAFDILSDPQAKAQYDRGIYSGFSL